MFSALVLSIMELTIDNQLRKFIPLADFQKAWHLPHDFGVAHFEPKNWDDLGSIAGAGSALTGIKQIVLQAVPAHISLNQLMPTVDRLVTGFRIALEAANQQIGLRPVEVDFAVAGFQDILQDVVYRLIQLHQLHRQNITSLQSDFDFNAVYQHWLDNGTRVAVQPKCYEYNGQTFRVYLIYNPYGRVGFKVAITAGAAEQIFYVADFSLACPAAAFMRSLAEEVSLALSRSL
jgi:hypothetical protein